MSDTPNTRAVLQAADGRWTYSIKDFCESMERKLNEVQRERDEYRGLLIELYNDLNIIHSGNAVRKLSKMFREENYN
ncbi:MAG: hypothetical protein ACK5H0_10295 [Bacteroidota bacterium]|jgi:hypothetical protein